MSEENKALVARFIDEWINGHDVQAFYEICNADIAFHWGALGEGRGVSELQAKEEDARAAFPDLTATSDWMIAADDLVVQRSTVTATHRGTWFGIEATGMRATWTAMEAYRIENGKIAEQWLNEDWTSVLQQLGAWPGP